MVQCLFPPSLPSIVRFCFIGTIASGRRAKTTTICNVYLRTHVLIIDEDDKVDIPILERAWAVFRTRLTACSVLNVFAIL